MIQFSGIQINSVNQTGKIAAKEIEGEQATGFEALLQLIGQVQGQQEEEETEPFGFNNQLVQSSFMMQSVFPLTVLEQEKLEKLSVEVQTQVQTNIELQKQTAEPPLSQSNITNLVTVFGQTGEVQPEVATLFQDPVSGELVNEAGIRKVVPDEELKQTELPDLNQTVKSSLADAFTMAHSTPTNQPSISTDKVVPTQTVQANQFEQEVTKFLQSSINITGLEDGIEAAFTLAPKHLGKVDVKVTIHDGQVTAEFLTSTPMGKELLETHVQTLRSALETQGFQIGKIDISQQITNTNFMGTFSQKGDSQARQGQQDSRKRSESVQLQTKDEYRDFIADAGWVSQINTTV